MVDTLKLFVSAANDLPHERELIGQIITELPVTLGWQINLSQIGKHTSKDELILDADFHLIIIGEDIRAPIGYEWYLSRNAGHQAEFLIKNNIPRTIAGRDFVKNLSQYPFVYQYKSLAEFRKLALTKIGEHIKNNASYYEIQSNELHNISKFFEDIEVTEPNLLDNVTAKDSIILTRERFTPKNGILIDAPRNDHHANETNPG